MSTAPKRLVLSSPVQAALFEREICGQLSDGRWENSRPADHWRVWVNADVSVAAPGEPVGASFDGLKTYNLCDSELLEAVGDRMRGYARLAELWGRDAALELAYFADNGGKMPNHAGKHWDEKRAELRAALLRYGLGESAVADELGPKLDKTWPMKRLRQELRALKRAMETRLP